jgi:hypothetical protein
VVDQRCGAHGDHVGVRQHVGRALGRQVAGVGPKLQHRQLRRHHLQAEGKGEVADDDDLSALSHLSQHIGRIHLDPAALVNVEQRVQSGDPQTGLAQVVGVSQLGELSRRLPCDMVQRLPWKQRLRAGALAPETRCKSAATTQHGREPTAEGDVADRCVVG